MSTKAVRHTSGTVALAKTMYGDGDAWTPTQIARYLAEQGTPASVVTIRRWVDPDYAERRRIAQRAEARARRGAPVVSDTPMLDRMRQLRAGGVFFSQIALVLRIDHGLKLTEGQVRYYLRKGREPVLPKRTAGATS
jgi:hypothetical protein